MTYIWNADNTVLGSVHIIAINPTIRQHPLLIRTISILATTNISSPGLTFDLRDQTIVPVPNTTCVNFFTTISKINLHTTASTVTMASELPVKTSLLKAPDHNIIKEMIHIYLEAYKNDKTVQLKYILPKFIKGMAEIIALRCKQPECEFIVARTEDSNQVVGWIALAFKLDKSNQISEEHVLYAQYALLPDLVAKAKSEGIGTADLKNMAHNVLKDFKEAREKHLAHKHCIIGTLVVDPKYQNKGVASALLTKAISRSEVFSFPIWVQAPSVYQSLFEKHLFEQVSEYELDLNGHVPTPDGKGKTKAAVSTFDKYAWKFMVRKEPLEDAIRAYKSSKVFAEQEEERRVDERRLAKIRELKSKSKAAGKKKVGPKLTDLLSGGDVQTATSGGGLLTRDAHDDDDDVGPSTPLLKKLMPKGGR